MSPGQLERTGAGIQVLAVVDRLGQRHAHGPAAQGQGGQELVLQPIDRRMAGRGVPVALDRRQHGHQRRGHAGRVGAVRRQPGQPLCQFNDEIARHV